MQINLQQAFVSVLLKHQYLYSLELERLLKMYLDSPFSDGRALDFNVTVSSDDPLAISDMRSLITHIYYKDACLRVAITNKDQSSVNFINEINDFLP